MNKFKKGHMVMTDIETTPCNIFVYGVITSVNEFQPGMFNYTLNNSKNYLYTVAECWLKQI